MCHDSLDRIAATLHSICPKLDWGTNGFVSIQQWNCALHAIAPQVLTHGGLIAEPCESSASLGRA